MAICIYVYTYICIEREREHPIPQICFKMVFGKYFGPCISTCDRVAPAMVTAVWAPVSWPLRARYRALRIERLLEV